MTRVLADYCRGRCASAVAAASCLSRGPGNWNHELPARLVRAMVLSRRGEVRAALARASEVYVTRADHSAGSLPGGDWPDRLIGEILLRDAEAMILDASFPADPCAP